MMPVRSEPEAHSPIAGSGEDDSREAVLWHDSGVNDEPIAADANAHPAMVPIEVVEVHRDNLFVAYVKRLKGAGQPGPAWFAYTWDVFPSFIFTAITLIVLAVIEAFGLQPHDLGLLSFLPSFGASCCMVMCLLTSPGAQPRSLISTHVIGAFLGVSWGHICKNLPEPLSQQLAAAFAVSMMTVIMLMTGMFQPSASATVCLAALHTYGQMKDQGFMFVVTPALLGPVIIVFLGWVFNNLVPWRHCYPVWY